MRKKDERTRTLLLKSAREIAGEQGIEAINIRRLAKRAQIATGTVYNYFADKDDVLLALTEEDWADSLKALKAAVDAGRFSSRIGADYTFLREHIHASAGGMMSALMNVRKAGCARMETMQLALRNILEEQLTMDGDVKSGVWDASFTQAQFVDFVLENLILLLRQDAQDAAVLTGIIERILY